MAMYLITNKQEPVDFETREPLARTIQNAKNLLMTRMGEVPYDRQRGLDPRLFDLPITKMREELTPELDRVMLREPDAKVVGADCYLDEKNQAIIECVVEIGV